MTEAARGFAQSAKANPDDFLSDGETPDAAKMRIMGIVKTVVENGLSMRDGQLDFGLNMRTAKSAIAELKGEDDNFMRHANDSLLNRMGVFLSEWRFAHMPPVKFQKRQPKNISLNRIQRALSGMYERGFDKETKPRRRLGEGSSLRP